MSTAVGMDLNGFGRVNDVNRSRSLDGLFSFDHVACTGQRHRRPSTTWFLGTCP